jgi:hypothetical protein
MGFKRAKPSSSHSGPVGLADDTSHRTDCVSGLIEHGSQFIDVMQGPLVMEPSLHLLDLARIPPTRLRLTSERRYRSRTQGCPARNRDNRNRARHAGNRIEAHSA